MIDSEGPSQSISNAIYKISQLEEFWHLFVPPEDGITGNEELIDDAGQGQKQNEQEEGDENDSLDPDYKALDAGGEEYSANENTIVLRNRIVERQDNDELLSPPSSPFISEIMDEADEIWNGFQRIREAVKRGETIHISNAAESVFSSVKTRVNQEAIEAETLPGHVSSDLTRIDALWQEGGLAKSGEISSFRLPDLHLAVFMTPAKPFRRVIKIYTLSNWILHQVMKRRKRRRTSKRDNNNDDRNEVEVDKEEEDENNDEDEHGDDTDGVQSHTRSKYLPLRIRSRKCEVEGLRVA
ncbi:hypothetical protein EDD11_008513 [Mortierella claussenii]|nr:hypothetical protein EDD11_008513 [Mortierella claussenii]